MLPLACMDAALQNAAAPLSPAYQLRKLLRHLGKRLFHRNHVGVVLYQNPQRDQWREHLLMGQPERRSLQQQRQHKGSMGEGRAAAGQHLLSHGPSSCRAVDNSVWPGWCLEQHHM